MKKEQWKDTFSDAMNELSDEYVQESRENTKSGNVRKKRIIAGLAVGLAAAAAVVIGVIAGPKIFSKEPKTTASGVVVETQESENGEKAVNIENCALVTAEYPERIVPPEDYNSSLWNEKYEETRWRRELAKNYEGRLTDFTKESVKALLSEEETNPLGSPANFYLALAMLAEASEGEKTETG